MAGSPPTREVESGVLQGHTEEKQVTGEGPGWDRRTDSTVVRNAGHQGCWRRHNSLWNFQRVEGDAGQELALGKEPIQGAPTSPGRRGEAHSRAPVGVSALAAPLWGLREGEVIRRVPPEPWRLQPPSACWQSSRRLSPTQRPKTDKGHFRHSTHSLSPLGEDSAPVLRDEPDSVPPTQTCSSGPTSGDLVLIRRPVSVGS